METSTVFRTFIIGKKGNAHVPLRLTEITLFYYAMKLTFAVDSTGVKYIIHLSLSELEEILCRDLFFRVTRQVILNINSIRDFKCIEFGKIAITLKAPELLGEGKIIISQSSVNLFKDWITNL